MSNLRVLSSHIFLNQRLHPGLLDQIARTGAEAIEIFAARQHFDYTSREHIDELASWFRSNPTPLWSLHAPIYPDLESGRAGAPAINVIHPDKGRRIAAMDEVKRCLESAEDLGFKNLVLHLGERDDEWSTQTVEHALTAIEHLAAFARPLGVRILLENLLSAPTTPVHLKHILTVGHFDSLGVCLDFGHAHITVGVLDAIETLGNRIASCHVHDNHGLKDEHLWPGMGSIDFKDARLRLAQFADSPALVLEITPPVAGPAAELPTRTAEAWNTLA